MSIPESFSCNWLAAFVYTTSKCNRIALRRLVALGLSGTDREIPLGRRQDNGITNLLESVGDQGPLGGSPFRFSSTSREVGGGMLCPAFCKTSWNALAVAGDGLK
jgi:hypothetical protein